MHHREPPRIVAEDPRTRSVPRAASDRLALPPPATRTPGRVRIDQRHAMRSLAILGGVLVGSYMVYLTARAAHSWLGDQPAYQLPFRAIVLDPPPPSWYRGGPAGFLEDVRRRAKMPEVIPLLKPTEVNLERAFEQSPWTEEVRRITHEPFGVTVRLAYRRPVAVVEVSDTEKYLLDESTVILPQEDLNGDEATFDRERRLIRIKGRGLSGPLNPIPGLTWKPKPGATDLAPGNDRIPAAAKLARFLEDKMQSIDKDREPALVMQFINPMDAERRGLFLWNVQSTIILWGDAPGEEAPGSLTAEEKWERLRAWSRRTRVKAASEDDFWKVTAEGVEQKIVTEHAYPESASIIPPRRDGATIPAKGSGQ